MSPLKGDKDLSEIPPLGGDEIEVKEEKELKN